MGITYGDNLIDSGHYDITPEQEREIWAREECKRRGIDPDEICADGGVEAWMVVEREARPHPTTPDWQDILSRGMPFGFDPATNFFHANDGGAPESCVFYEPSTTPAEGIADAVLAWLVKRDALDADNEYRAPEVIAAFDDLMADPTTPEAQAAVLDAYDAGLLNDYGGGNVEWWQDYIRAELGRAHDFYQSQVGAATPEAQAGSEAVAWRVIPDDPGECDDWTADEGIAREWIKRGFKVVPLYASPPDATYWKGEYDRMAARNVELEAALRKVKDKAGSHTVSNRQVELGERDHGYAGIYAVADAALSPTTPSDRQ